MQEVFLGLGSNLGNRYGYLKQAISFIKSHPGIELVAESPVYETTAVGFTEQPDFLNMVVKVYTSLSPENLLQVCLEVEKLLGRVRGKKWGPRTLDIDLLFYGKLQLIDTSLQIPHPRLHERAFVLLPLRDIAPNWVHPKLGVTIQELTEQVPGKEGVRRWEKPLGSDCAPTES